jgi:ribonuclease BN (tRNA processing enzyme)
LAKNTDALVICCYLSRTEMLEREGRLTGKHILACSPQVGQIAARANARKIVLTHIRSKSEDLMTEMVDEIKSDYSGRIIAGKDLMRIRI